MSPLQVQRRLAGGALRSAQRSLPGPQRDGDATPLRAGRGRGEPHHSGSEMLPSGRTWTTFAQISLDRATDTGTSKIEGPETLNPLQGLERKGDPEISVSTAGVENHLATRGSKDIWEHPGKGRRLKKKKKNHTKNFRKNMLS